MLHIRRGEIKENEEVGGPDSVLLNISLLDSAGRYSQETVSPR